MDAIELQTLAAKARLAQLDLDAIHLAARVDQATDDEVGQAVAERDCALDSYEEAKALAALGALRCDRCGSDHGRRGFSIGRTRHGDYEYDAAWGESLKSIKTPAGWHLAYPNATEPNVIECDCWPNGVRSYLRK